MGEWLSAEYLPRKFRRRMSSGTGSRDFVSREEELVAQAMTALKWEWEYEVYELVFSNGERLISLKPDFLVKTPDGDIVFIEVKGSPERRGAGKKGRRHKRPRTLARRAGVDFALLYCPKVGQRRLRRRLKRALVKARKQGNKARRNRGLGYWLPVRVQKCRRVLFVPVVRAQAG